MKVRQMRTSKPIATISYNSPEFLTQKLDELVRNHKISDWIFINHFAEEDEKKDHIHLWIKPNTLVDTMDLQQFLTELNPADPKKPFKCIDFKPSVIDDWILYCQHFNPYLATKGESREYHYTRDDFVYCDEDTFDDLYHHAFKGSDWAQRNQILQQLSDNMVNPAQLILNGTVPLNLATQLNALRYMQTHIGLDRGEHEVHD